MPESGSRPPNPSERVLARRRTVSSYMVRGLTLSQIASLTGVSLRTAYRDVSAVRRQWSKEANWSRDRDRAVEDLIARSRERAQTLWATVYGAGANLNAKIGALNALREEDARLIGHLQSLGALPREPDVVRERADDWRTQLRRIAAQRLETRPSVN